LPGIPDLNHEAAVGFKSGANIPAATAVWRPGVSVGGFVMGDDADSGRGNGCLVEVERAMELGPSR
jgi:hypothetical protein